MTSTDVPLDPTEHIGIALLRAAQRAGGVEDLRIPTRTGVARAADFGSDVRLAEVSIVGPELDN